MTLRKAGAGWPFETFLAYLPVGPGHPQNVALAFVIEVPCQNK